MIPAPPATAAPCTAAIVIKTRLTQRDQRVRDHLRGRVRLRLVGRFLQIESGAKCCPAPRKMITRCELFGRDLDGGDQFTE